MVAHEIINRLPVDRVVEMLAELRAASRTTYRAGMDLIASRRKLRPVFLEKKPLPERHNWMAAELAKKANGDLATEILQGWLFECRKPMLVHFLDAVGATHDGNGVLQELPPEPSVETLEAAVGSLLQDRPAWEVFVYLNLFCEMDIADWPKLRELAGTISIEPGGPASGVESHLTTP